MHINIDIDDSLFAEAQRLGGTSTDKTTIEYALSELIRRRPARSALGLRGKLDIEPDPERSSDSRRLR